jgi:type I restriction enzyme S subunit
MSNTETARLEALASLVTDKAIFDKDPTKRYVGLEHIPSSGSAIVELGLAGDSISANNIFREGDILFGKLRPRLRKSVRVNWAGYCSTDILVLRSNDAADALFVSFVFRSEPVFREAIRTEEGTKMPRCSWRSLRALEVFYPPNQCERSRIAEILSTLDETIEQTEATIAKYQQIKAGLMHDLFTRGLTPEGQLRPERVQAPRFYKESPVGWFPKDWNIVMLGASAEIVSGVTLGSNTNHKGGVEVPYLRVANVQDGYLDLSEMKTVTVPQSYVERLRLRNGDVLMNEGGDFDKLGRGCIWREELSPCIHQNHVFRVRPQISVLRSEYLAYWCESEFGKRYFRLCSKQSTNLASINSSQLNRMPLALPTPEEQREMELRISGVNNQINSLRTDVFKLRNLKHGLTQDLLTGRVRVNLTEAATA